MNKKNIKKMLFGFAVLAIAAIVAFNINANSKIDGLSDISLANAEALAKGEIGPGAWIITFYSTEHWECRPGGGWCCLEWDC